MIIKILQDNTVHVKYPDGKTQTLNNTHSHKARTPLVKAICDSFPYKGAMEFTTDYEAPVFVFDNCTDCPEPLKTAMGDYYTELCSLKEALDGEEDYQATETVEVTEEVTEVIGDKAVIKTVTKTKEIPLTDEIPCVDENGDGICDVVEHKHTDEEGNETVEHEEVPKTIKVPRMIKGKKVSDADKARLAELLGSL